LNISDNQYWNLVIEKTSRGVSNLKNMVFANLSYFKIVNIRDPCDNLIFYSILFSYTNMFISGPFETDKH
jgi:hypothetical protein